MELKIAKICRYTLLVLMLVGLLFGILFFAKIIDENAFIILGYVMLVLAVIALLASPIMSMIEDPRNIKTFLIYIALFVVVAGISYLIAGNTYTDAQLEASEITPQISRIVSAGCNFCYIMFGGAIAAIIFAVVYKSIQK